MFKEIFQTRIRIEEKRYILADEIKGNSYSIANCELSMWRIGQILSCKIRNMKAKKQERKEERKETKKDRMDGQAESINKEWKYTKLWEDVAGANPGGMLNQIHKTQETNSIC